MVDDDVHAAVGPAVTAKLPSDAAAAVVRLAESSARRKVSVDVGGKTTCGSPLQAVRWPVRVSINRDADVGMYR